MYMQKYKLHNIQQLYVPNLQPGKYCVSFPIALAIANTIQIQSYSNIKGIVILLVTCAICDICMLLTRLLEANQLPTEDRKLKKK